MSSSSLYRRLHGIFIKPPLSTISITPPKTAKYTLPISTPTTLTTSSTKDQKLKLLVKKFKKASNSPNFRHHLSRYETTVLRLANSQQFALISDILEHQKQYPNITNEKFTVRLISLYGKSGMFDHAHKLFDEMPQLNCPRTVTSFNALLSACINSKKFDKINDLFRELPDKLCIQPDCVSYNTMIKAFCEMGLCENGVEVIDKMEKNGIKPDLVTFNTLIDAFYKNNQVLDAEKMWALMEENSLVPNVRSYNTKLRWLVGENRVLEAVDMVEEMGKKGVKPDVYSFNALIQGFCDEGNLKETKTWFHKIAQSDCVPDRITFMVLIPFVCRNGDFGFGLELCKEAISRRFLVETRMLQCVVDGLVKAGMVKEAKELVQLGKLNDYFHYKLKGPVQE